MVLSCHYHPSLLPLFVSLLLHPIWACMGEICWRLWVTRVSNELFIFCQHDFAFPVGVETFYGCGCLVGIRFSASLDIICCGCSCNLLDCSQILCRMVFLLLLLLLLLVLLCYLFLYCFAALCVGSLAVMNVIFTSLYIGFCLPLCRIV